MSERKCEICEGVPADDGILIVLFVCNACRQGKTDEQLFIEALARWKNGRKVLSPRYYVKEEV